MKNNELWTGKFNCCSKPHFQLGTSWDWKAQYMNKMK